jgi:hypothetical protein
MQEQSSTPFESGANPKRQYEDLFPLTQGRRKNIIMSDSPEKLLPEKTQKKHKNNARTIPTFGSISSLKKAKQISLNTLDSAFLNWNQDEYKKFQLFSSRKLIKQSGLICKKCKHKLLSESQNKTILVKSKMFSKSEKPELKNISPQNSEIFCSLSQVKAITLESKNLIAMRMQDLNMFPENPKQSSPMFFSNLKMVLLKFLLNENLSTIELHSLSFLEQKLFMLFVRKKKELGDHTICPSLVDSLSKNWTPKRFEENLRYVLNKAFKFLTSAFNKRVFFQLEKLMNPEFRRKQWKVKFNYGFYGYYFERTSKKNQTPIETYFHPKAGRFINNVEKSILSKTISQNYLKLLCSSHLFKRDLTTYIEHCLMVEAKNNILTKVDRLCGNWEKILKAQGEVYLVENVEKQFISNPKCKVAWGMIEVGKAIEDVMKIVNGENDLC